MTKLINQFDLKSLSTDELLMLLERSYEQLILSEIDSANRRNALASIENIERNLGH